jgi:hypothetical protein
LDQYSYNKSHYTLSGVRIIHQTTVRWCSWLSRQSNIPVSITEGLQFKSGSNHFFVVSRGLGFGEKPSFCFWGISAATVTRLLRSQVPKLRGVQCSDAACVLVRPEYPLGLGDRLLWFCVLCVALHNRRHRQWLPYGGGFATVWEIRCDSPCTEWFDRRSCLSG